MFAPVAVRFRGYGVRCLPAMREWLDAAAAEPEHITAIDALALA